MPTPAEPTNGTVFMRNGVSFPVVDSASLPRGPFRAFAAYPHCAPVFHDTALTPLSLDIDLSTGKNPLPVDPRRDEMTSTRNGNTEEVGEYTVPLDPADATHCDSCQ
ncbi:MAG: hypothetical protein JWR57_1019 [Mycetocola sp.]|nr:hypothetical protein [Mycetocola sp.]